MLKVLFQFLLVREKPRPDILNTSKILQPFSFVQIIYPLSEPKNRGIYDSTKCESTCNSKNVPASIYHINTRARRFDTINGILLSLCQTLLIDLPTLLKGLKMIHIYCLISGKGTRKPWKNPAKSMDALPARKLLETKRKTVEKFRQPLLNSTPQKLGGLNYRKIMLEK